MKKMVRSVYSRSWIVFDSSFGRGCKGESYLSKWASHGNERTPGGRWSEEKFGRKNSTADRFRISISRTGGWSRANGSLNSIEYLKHVSANIPRINS